MADVARVATLRLLTARRLADQILRVGQMEHDLDDLEQIDLAQAAVGRGVYERPERDHEGLLDHELIAGAHPAELHQKGAQAGAHAQLKTQTDQKMN